MNTTPTLAGRLLLTLRLGEMPEQMPAWQAHVRYGVPLAQEIDGGIIDRLLRHHGGALRCARLHSALQPRKNGVAGARRFDDTEQLSGVARVLRIEVQHQGQLMQLVRDLRQVPTVQSALVEHLSFSHFEPTPHAVSLAEVDVAHAWAPHELVRLPQALGYTQGDPAVVIGLADTGVNLHHPGLPAAALRRGFDTVDLGAMSFGNLQLVGDVKGSDVEPSDEVGHGTGCAGILRADGLGLPPGGAGRCSLLPMRVLASAMSGSGASQRRVGVGSIANIDAGMKRLVDLGAKVINMSFGTAQSQLPEGGDLPHLEVVRYALARGVILVAASGNNGQVERYFPAAHEGVIAVGSVNLRGEPSKFSTQGKHVALCAPGEGIWTCGLDQASSLARVNGTSFAAPFVSAACALLVARAESRGEPLDATLAAQILRTSCRPHLVAQNPSMHGHGVLDVWAALRALDAHFDEALEDPIDPPNTQG
jgi:subtilisin family serine protease